MDKKTERALINRYINMRDLMEADGHYIAPNGTLFCPFHQNQNTKAAHYYSDDGGGCVFCFAEYKQYSSYDYYTILKQEIDVHALAELLWSKLPKAEQDAFITNLGVQQEYQELPFLDSLKQFKEGKINYHQLMGAIHLKLPVDETIQMVEKIYNSPNVKQFNPTNKYLYYMQNFDNKYKLVSAYQLINSISDLPDFVYQHLMAVGDCILIPNIIDNQIYSVTFRAVNNNKRFLKYGEFSTLMYNLGELPEDFTYGTPLVIVEGNLDTDVMKQIYPYTLGALTANLTRNHIQLLGHLTNTVILAFDNDEAGHDGIESALRRLPNMKVLKFNYKEDMKDAGDLIDLLMKSKDEYEFILNIYRSRIHMLINS